MSYYKNLCRLIPPLWMFFLSYLFPVYTPQLDQLRTAVRAAVDVSVEEELHELGLRLPTDKGSQEGTPEELCDELEILLLDCVGKKSKVSDTGISFGKNMLDEPEAALSPQRQLTLMLEIIRCARSNAQFIIVTHSPILLGMPDSEILSFDSGRIHPIEYEETDSYRITEMFIRDRKRFLSKLLDEEAQF